MGKIVYALMFAAVVELALVVFGGVSISTTALLSFMLNPSEATVLWVAFLALLLVGVAGIVASSFAQTNINGAFAVLASTVTIAFALNLFHLASFMGGALGDLGEIGKIITALVTGTFALTYMIITAEWIRGNQ